MTAPSKSFRSRRRGTTLAESMMASVLLATCVVGITGTIMAAYQNQSYAQARREAAGTGRKLMENITSLPLDPATAGQASIADYQPATTTSQTTTVRNQGALGALLSALTFNIVNLYTTSNVTTTTVTPGSPTAPVVNVDRRSSVNGPASLTGDFAVVTVAVPMAVSGNAPQTVKLKRLVTSVEANANQNP